jgi:Peptidase A4 family
MTSVRRACLAAIAAAALVLTAAAAGRPVPARDPDASVPAAAAVRPGPIVPVSLPHGLAAAAGLHAVSNIGSEGSANWAGYAVTGRGGRFNALRATFFVPYLTCTKALGQTLSSDWVGFDGFTSKPDSVEQGGIGADCSTSAKASYYAWWEMYPEPETRISVRVRPGDSVTATISYDTADKDFRITLADNTTGGHFAVTRKCPDVKIGKRSLICPRNSAEVISEAPATGSSSQNAVIAHLSDYDAVSFGAISITNSAGRRGALVSSHWSTTKIIQLRPSGAIVALPTPIQGGTFDNYWLREN